MGLRLTTKVQVSGWRFLLRRVEHAIVRRDTRMFDDPLQFYSRAVSCGIALAVVLCLGAVVMAFFKPLGKRGGDSLLVDRTTNELFVVMPGTDELRPVYNLTSARLILGNAATPQAVKSEDLAALRRGQPVGIPGAPYATTVSDRPGQSWTVCDTVTRPESVAPTVTTSVATLPVTTDAGVGPVRPGQGLLVSFRDRDWLVTADGRHAVNLADRPVTSAVGIPVTAAATPISEGMFNALPNAGPWELPPVPAAGAPSAFDLPGELVHGAVFATATDTGEQLYVVMPDGVARVNAVTAAALRARDSYGLLAPPVVEASRVAAIPEQFFASPLPDAPLQLLGRQQSPVLCWSWVRQPGEQAPTTTVLAGRRLPIPADATDTGIRQISGAATVYTDAGQFVRLQSPDPRYGESLYYVDPQGVRYGLPDERTAAMLGLTGPATAPWQAIGLLIDGPVLSVGGALLEHDTLAPNPNPRRAPGGAGSAAAAVGGVP